MNAENTFRNIQDLTGIGYEYLIDAEGNCIGQFYNGQLWASCVEFKGNSDETKAVA